MARAVPMPLAADQPVSSPGGPMARTHDGGGIYPGYETPIEFIELAKLAMQKSQDMRAQALLEARPDLQQATGLTGTEPPEGLHSLLAERLSLLPPAQRDNLWGTIATPGVQAAEPDASIPAGPGAAEAEADGPGTQGRAPDFPRPLPVVAADLPVVPAPSPLSPLDDRDYARAQALQFWHARIEPLLGLAARGSEAIEAAERVLRDPEATPGEVRARLGAVSEYQAVISKQWDSLSRSELPMLVRNLRELRLVGGEAEAARIDGLIDEIEHPRPLQEFAAKREALDRTEREHQAGEPRQRAVPLPDHAPEYDGPDAAPSP